MTTLDRYITRLTFMGVVTVLGAFLALTSVFTLFEELSEPAASYGIVDVSMYMLRTTPQRLEDVLVYSVFIGTLIALGRLAETSELTIIRATGMSPQRLIVATLPSTFLWLLMSVAITETIAPAAERTAEIDKLKALYGQDALKNSPPLWFRTGPMFMQIGAIEESGDLLRVVQYTLGDNLELTHVTTAERARYNAYSANWNLLHGTTTQFVGAEAISDPFIALTWENAVSPSVLASQALIDARKMTLLDLHAQINFASSQNIGVSEYQLAFWARIMKPLSFIGLTVFALSIVLGPLRETSMGVRLTVGIFAGLGFKYLQDLLSPAAIVFDIPAALAVFIPIAAYWAVAIYFIRKNA